MRKIIYSSLMLGAILLVSCSKDFTDTDQGSTFSDTKVQELAKFPEAALRLTESVEAGTYNTMIKRRVSGFASEEDFGQKAVDIMMDAMGTDMVFPSSNWFVFHYNYTGGRLANNRAGVNYNYYAKLAHNANLIIKFVSTSNPDYVNSEIYGRALALRAFANFTQIRLLANGDLGISYEYVDLNDKSKLVIRYERVPTKEVYTFIENDLLTSDKILSGFVSSNKGVIDGNVVSGMLSRLYLELKDWNRAKEYALKALDGNLYSIPFNVLNNGFNSITNAEVMWGAAIDGSNTTTWTSFFSHMDTLNEGYGGFGESPKLVDERLYAQIDANDSRKKWFYSGEGTHYVPYLGEYIGPDQLMRLANVKFLDTGAMTGDYIYMRKSEMLLNYAEAAFEGGDETGAKKALNELMATRLNGYSANKYSGDLLRNEIRLQRRVELWGEGFGLLDIKRWGIAVDRASDVVVNGKNVKSSHGYIVGTKSIIPASSDLLRFQFPIAEINANPKLTPQNP